MGRYWDRRRFEVPLICYLNERGWRAKTKRLWIVAVVGGLLMSVGGLLIPVGAAYAQVPAGAPTVEAVAVTSDPGDDGGYAIGETIEIGLTFSEDVRATGSPQIALDIGGDPKTAAYSGAGTRQLLFSYTVEEGVEDTDGFEITADSLTRNGGTIQSVDDSTDAVLGHTAFQAGDGHLVDGIVPEVQVILPEAQFVDPDRLMSVVLVFTEPVFNLTTDEITVTNGTAHDILATPPTDEHPRFSRWDFLVEPHGEGPITVQAPEGVATDAFGNGNDPSRTVTKIAATPVDVEVALSTSGFAEGGTAEFILSRSLDNGEIPVSISVDDSGDFVSGTVEIARASDPDNPLEATFQGTPATIEVTFEAGELSKRIKVFTDDDLLDEPDGSITVRVVDDSSQYKYVAGWSRSATSAVRDNDEPVEVGITWIPNQISLWVFEGLPVRFSLSRTSDSGEMAVYGRIIQEEGDYLDTSGAEGFEYLDEGRIRAVLAPGQLVKTLSFSTRSNQVLDDPSSDILALTLLPESGAGYYVSADNGTAKAIIVDDDFPPTVNISADARSVTEGGQAVFTLTRNFNSGLDSPSSAVTVDLEVSQQGSFLAESGELGPDTPGPVTVQATFPPFTYTMKVRLDTLDDDVSENAGVISVTVAPAAGGAYLVGDSDTASLAVRDNELPVITVRPVGVEVTEGEDAVFRFTRFGANDGALNVGVYVGGHQKIMTPETEAIVLNSEKPLQLVDAIVAFGAGETEATLSLSTLGDNRNEGDGRLVVWVARRGNSPYVRGVPSRAEVLVKDDDIPTVSIRRPVFPEDATLSESGDTWEGEVVEGNRPVYGIECTGDYEYPGLDVDVGVYPNRLAIYLSYVQLLNHPARYFFGRQFTPPRPFHPGNNFLGHSVITDCRSDEDIQPTSQGNKFYVGPDNGTITIHLTPSNDLVPAVLQEVYDRLQGPLQEAKRLGVPFTTAPDLVWGNGQEPIPFFTCTDELRFCPQYVVGTPNKIKITVLNRDPAILIKVESAEVNEGQPARFILERRWNAQNLAEYEPPWSDTRVLLRTSVEGEYVTGMLPSEVTFGQGETRKVIELATVGDSAFAEDGSVTIEVLPDTTGPEENVAAKYRQHSFWLGHTPEGGRSDRATVTIVNDDRQPGILISDATASESDGSMTFDVTLTNPWVPEVTVNWATSDGTATAGTDYTAANGTITFPYGDISLSRTITVPILNDTEYESDETFTITLSEPAGAGFPGGGTTATATGTIEDDDVQTLPEINIHKRVETSRIWQEGAFVGVLLSRAERDSDEELALDFYVGGVDSEDREVVNVVFPQAVTVVSKGFYLPDDEQQNGRRQIAAELYGDSGPGAGPDQVWRPGPNWRTVFDVEDDDGLPKVSVRAKQLWVEEGQDAVFLLTRDIGLDEELTVTVYRYLPGPTHTFTATFPQGEATIEAVVPRDREGQAFLHPYNNYTTHDDEVVNDPSDREVWVRLVGDSEDGVDEVWTEGNPSSASLWVYDNDPQHGLVLLAEVESGGPGNPVVPGETVTVLFDVINSGTVATGAGVVIGTTHPGMGNCELGRIASGATSRCIGTFTATRVGSFSFTATARDSFTDTGSNRIVVSYEVEEGPALLAFEQTSVSVTEGSPDDGETVTVDLTVNVAEGKTGDVTVDYSMSPSGASPAVPGEDYVEEFGTLTFAPGETTATIRVIVLNDNVHEPTEGFQVLLANPTHATLDPEHDVATVSIDDRPGTPKPVASVYFNEDGPVPESEGSAEFVVRLDRTSGHVVNLEASIPSPAQGTATVGTDYDIDTRAIAIQPGQTEALFSVEIVDDEEDEDDETFVVEIDSSDTNVLLSSENSTAEGTIADDDDTLPTAITLSASPDAVDEGEEMTVTVTAELDADELDADPLDTDITVRVSVGDGSRGGNAADGPDFDAIEPFEIVISAGQTRGSRTFQLTTRDDDLDETDETIVLQGEIADENEADALLVTPVTLTITDDDTRGVTVNPVLITLEESGEGTSYQVRLDSTPTETVTIRVEPMEGGHLSVNPLEITFTQENWNRDRRVNVLAMEDGDTLDNSPTSISHSASGGDYDDVVVDGVTVNVTEMTVPEISVSQARVSEGDGELEFLVSLAPSFGESVDVQYELIDGTAEAGSDYTKPEGGAQTLRFQAGQTQKTIRVPVTDDGVDEEDEEIFFLRLTDISDEANLSGGVSTLEGQGTIEDNDATPAASVNGPDGTVSFVPESVGTVTFSITLEGATTKIVSVDYSTGNLPDAISDRAGGIVNALEDEDYTGVEGTVAFQPGETTKAVSVDVTNDNVSEAIEYFAFDISNPRNAYLKQTGARAAILDNDRRRVVVAPISLMLAEGGAAGAYTVSLATEPTENVTVTIGGYAGTDVSVDETSLTFTPEDWGTAQPVEVTAREDDDAVNDTVTLTHTPTGGDYEGLDADGVTVTVIDNDTAKLVLSETALTISEGESAEYTVKLASEPAATVVVSFGIPAGSGLATEPRRLVFTVDNWNEEQPVEVTSYQDDDAVDDTAAITHMPIGGDYGPAHNADLTMTVTDQDTPGLIISPAALTVDEGATADYTVRLATEPTETVTVTISREGDVSVEPDSLTFTVIKWSHGQTVTASAGPDADVTNDSATLSHTAGGGDYETVAEDLPVTVTDNSAEIVLSESAITVDEEGEDVSYTVKLAAQPTGPVIVTITGASETILSLEDDSLTFTVDDWNSEQEVIVSAGHDDDGSADEFTLTHTAGGGDYDSAPDAELQVTANDNDTADVIISETALTIDEGGDGTYTVKLKTEPTGEVTVTVNDPSNTDVTAEPESLTFTTETWNNAQPVTVSAKEDDDDTADEAATVTHTVSGADYEDVTAADLGITVIDNDDPQVTVSFGASAYTAAEGGTVDVTITLSADPEREVVVPLTKYGREEAGVDTNFNGSLDDYASSATDYSGVPESVTFESGDTEKTFTFEATDDTVDDDGESVKLGFGALPTGVTVDTTIPDGETQARDTATVAIADDDDPGVMVSFGASSYTAAEGGTVEVTVELSADPEREVVIPLTATGEGGASGADYSGVPESVTFESGDTSKSFTFEATDDALDDDGESVKLGFGSLPAGVTVDTAITDGETQARDTATVAITDDDKPASVTVNFEEGSYTVAEGGTVVVKVTLSDDPEMTVTVPLTATAQDGATGADYSGVPASVVFNAGDTEQSFTFEATDDTVDDDGESAKLAFGSLPAGVTAGATTESTVSITDDDDPGVLVSFGASSYSVAEGESVTVTVELSADPERQVVVPLTATNEGGASGADYSGVPESVTFESGDTSKSYTFEATDDTVDDDGESVKLGFGSLPDGVTGGDTTESTVGIGDDDKPASVTVNFEEGSYTVAEGGTVVVKVTLSDDPEMTVTVPLTATAQDGATGADYSGVPASVVFNAGDTEQSFTFEATDDTVDDDGESVKLAFGTLPDGVTGGDTAESTVSITDDDVPGVLVSFGASSYTVAEGGSVTVTIVLSADPEREVVILLTTTEQDGASGADYSGVPASVTFESGDTSKSFTFEATDDTVDDDGESVKLAFGSLPDGVTGGDTTESTVSIGDDDKPASVTVNFEQDSYTAAEGGSVTVKVTLSDDPEMTVTVPLTATDQDGATTADYSGVPASVVFNAGDTEQSFTFRATDDSVDDDGESAKLGFGSLPAGVTAGDTAESTVSITDDDDPGVAVSFGASSYTAAEGESATVTIVLSADPERQVVIPLTTTDQGGASDSDYSGVPSSVTFESGDISMSFTFEATDDAVDDDGESVLLGFGVMPVGVTVDTAIPDGETQARDTATVAITDDDKPVSVTVNFEEDSYTVAEGGSVTVKVTLSDDPEMVVTVPLTATEQGGASGVDYSGVPASVVFNAGDTEKSFTFNARDDAVDDDGESVKLGFGSLPAGVTAGDTAESTVSITDDDVPGVLVSFGASSYAVAEGGTVEVTVKLSADPERQVVIPLTATNEGGASDSDYSGVPASVTFESGDISMSFTFEATDDSVDDDGESVLLAFGVMPVGVTVDTAIPDGETQARDTSTVAIGDDDKPVSVTVNFEQDSYTAAEGGSVTVKVTLSDDPEMSVTVPLTATEQGGATTADYSGVPASVVFDAGDTEQVFTFRATDDSVDDDGESVKLGFGSLPAAVTAGDTDESTVSLTDDDDPGVLVSFGQAAYTAAEGGTVEVTVTLSADPERQVVIPLTTTNEGGASDSDYSGVPESLTFESGDISKSFTFEATDDAVDDDGESVLLGFGVMPVGVTVDTAIPDGETQARDTATVAITDDDKPVSVTVNFGQDSYTAAEGGSVTVKVTLSDDPEMVVTVPLTATEQGGASGVDYSGVPASVVFNAGDTEKSFTFNARDDAVDDDGESVKLGFGSLPAGVTAGDTAESTVSITDDDVPGVLVSFGASSYAVAEGGTVEVTVKLSADPERQVVIPLAATDQGGASDSDYSGVPESLMFESGDTSMSFTFEATDDAVDDDGESVKLGFGVMPVGVTVDTAIPDGETQARDTSTVAIGDDDKPVSVTVNFEQDSYTAAEGGSVTVKVTLSDDPEMTVTVPLTTTEQDGATGVDYSGVPASVTFNAGDTEKSFTFTAEADDVDDDGESVKLAFGSLPAGVTAGATAESTVSITDDDDPGVMVSFGASSYTAAEGGTVEVTVTLSADPERQVVIPLTATNEGGASGADYSGVPQSVTFESGDTSKTFTFEATDDAVDDDGESVKLAFGVMPVGVTVDTAIPAGETQARDTATVAITDDDKPASVTVNFQEDSYTVAEGGTVTVKVTLSDDPEMTVTVPLTATEQDGATTADYSGVPAGVTFNSGDTEQSFTFSAATDAVDDDGESVKLGFGTMPAGVMPGGTAESTVSITDDDDPGVKVGFGASSYTAAEGGTVEVTVTLSADPERQVVIPLTTTDEGGASGADYSGVPASLRFESGDTSMSFTFEATDDAVDDDGESVKLSFGTLPAAVTAGDTAEAKVSITDDDDPQLTVSFGASAYTAAEGGTVEVTVTLSADPEREVVIPLTTTEQDGASGADYSGVPESLTFESGDTSKTFTFEATDDAVDDAGESVKLGFGALPAGVTADTTIPDGETQAHDTATVAITDDTKLTLIQDCVGIVWCATLTFADKSSEDWGFHHLQFHRYSDPPSSLSSETFTFEEQIYTVVALSLAPGSIPWAAPDSSSLSEQGILYISIHMGTWEDQLRPIEPDGQGRWPQDRWTLYFDGIKLPFPKNGEHNVVWTAAELYTRFMDWAPGTTHQLRIVKTVNAEPSLTITVPGSPERLVVAPLDGDALLVEWSPPTYDGGSPVTGYRLQWKAADGDWGEPDDVDEVRVGASRLPKHIVHGGLATGVEYTLRVIATNEAGDGEPSDERSTIPQLETPQMRSVDVSADTVSLTYDRPLDTESIPATSTFEAYVNGGLRDLSTVAVEGYTVMLTLTSAVSRADQVSLRYIAPVKMTDAGIQDTDGYKAWSFFHSMITNTTDEGSVLPLTAEFRATPASHNGEDSFTFYIHFSEPVWVGQGTAWHSTLEVAGGSVTSAWWMDRNTGLWRIVVQPDSNGPMTIVLPAGRDCRLAGVPCASGERSVSHRVELTIPGPVSMNQDSAPAANRPATGGPGINGTHRADEILTATTSQIADEDGLTDAAFTYQWIRHNLITNTDTDIDGATASTYTIMSEDEGNAIKVRVTFRDDAGNEESLTSHAVVSAPPPPAVPPTAPENMTLHLHETGALKVLWEAPMDDGGSTITEYKVQWKRHAGNWDIPADVSEETVTATSYIITDLTDSVAYAVRVFAANRAGVGPPSPGKILVPRETTPPERSSVAVDGETLTLTYNEPLDEGSVPPVTAFAVAVDGATGQIDEVSVNGSSVLLTLASAVTASDLITLSYAVPSNLALPRIRDVAGNEAPSFRKTAAINLTTSDVGSFPEPEPLENPPPAPELLFASERKGSIALVWKAPADSSIVGYQILRRRPKEGEANLVVYVEDTESASTTFVDTDVQPGTTYIYRIKAINSAGLSHWSNHVRITLQPAETKVKPRPLGDESQKPR